MSGGIDFFGDRLPDRNGLPFRADLVGDDDFEIARKAALDAASIFLLGDESERGIEKGE